jgi:hypothetical protein
MLDSANRPFPHATAYFFDSHDHLYSIETIKTEIVVEVRLGVELPFLLVYALSWPGGSCAVPLKYPEPASEVSHRSKPAVLNRTLSKFFNRSIILPVTSFCDKPALAE